MLAAGTTRPEEGEVPDVEVEAGGARDTPDHVAEHVTRRFLHATALAAHEMDVVVVTGDGVRRCSVPEVRVLHEPELLEQLERSVDGGDVDPAGRPAYPFRDLVGSGVTERRDCFEHELALRGQAVSARAEARLPGVARLGRHDPNVGAASAG